MVLALTPADIIYTIWGTGFIAWVLLEILERGMNLYPKTFDKDLLEDAARIRQGATVTSPSRSRGREVVERNTKSSDKSKKFRTQRRGSVKFVKACFMMLWLIIVIANVRLKFDDVIEHFIVQARTPTDMSNQYWYQQIAVSVLAYYMWELAVDRYSTIDRASALHHHTTCFVVVSMIAFRSQFNPFASWFAFWGVFLHAPLNIALGFRSQLFHKYPKTTSRLLCCAKYFYPFTCIINVCGLVPIYVRAIVVKSVDTWRLVAMPFATLALLYNDYLMVKALWRLAECDFVRGAEVMSEYEVIMQWRSGPVVTNPGDEDANEASSDESDADHEEQDAVEMERITGPTRPLTRKQQL